MTGLRVVILLMLVQALSACVPMDSSKGTITSGFLGERRSPESAMEDNLLAIKLRGYYMRSDKVSAANINVSVYDGTVLLTGAAASQEEIDAALSIAKGTRGVVKVFSELKVQHASLTETTKDAWYTTEVKSRLLADEQVRGMDIHVETTKAVVYLMGMAQSVAERNRAVEVARQVKGVQEVVSFIEVKSSAQPVNSGNEPRKFNAPAPVRYGQSEEAIKPESVPVRRVDSAPAYPPDRSAITSGGAQVKPGASIDSGF